VRLTLSALLCRRSLAESAASHCAGDATAPGLNYLEQTLPYNSHVLFVGLVDGRVLWDIMHDQIHRTERQQRSLSCKRVA